MFNETISNTEEDHNQNMVQLGRCNYLGPLQRIRLKEQLKQNVKNIHNRNSYKKKRLKKNPCNLIC